MAKSWIDKKLDFIKQYEEAKNAASGSEVDANANVTTKNVATLQCEIVKDDMIKINRAIMEKYLTQLYGEEVASQYEEDLKNHIIYSHDETGIAPYCVAVSLYPFLLNGLKDLGGSSKPPKHADSYIGGMINLIFLLAGQYLGAVAVPEFLPYFDHFLRIDFGDDYINHLDESIILYGKRKETLRDRIEDWFQQFVYSINQPAGSRNYQSPFVNISYYDKGYFDSIFKDFVFPDGDEPKWETTKELQKIFIKWFNNERTKCDGLTFPVETFNLLFDKETHKYKDEESADFVADAWTHGHSFFVYNSDSADALSSCCRLKNAIDDNVFSYTLGAGGIQTGSKKVITLNMNRITQDWYKVKDNITLPEYVKTITSRVHKYLTAWNNWLWDIYDAGLLTVYKAGFISLDKQYLTCGINGFLEGAEFLGLEENDSVYSGIKPYPDNEQYKQFTKDVFETIKQLNKEDRTEHTKFNTEMVPAENAGAKLHRWDKRDGYWVPESRNLYNSYFYPVEDASYDVITKMKLHGKDFIGCLDGGSAYHCNLDTYLTKEQYRKLLDIAANLGCSYFTFNIPNTVCNGCGHIDKRYLDACPECGSRNVDYLTRIIGYLKRVSNFSEARQEEASHRAYTHKL